MKIQTVAISALLAIGMGFLVPAAAHQGATGVVKQRMEMMKDVARSMEVIGRMIKGESEFDRELARMASLSIIKHSKGMPDLFPSGSLDHPSEARPEIWEDWDRFLIEAEKMETAAEVFSEQISNTGSAGDLKEEFALLGQSCGSCHKKFRIKK